MRYGIGGTHAVVVPFMNFRMFGVLVVVALWSWAIATVEKKLLASDDVAWRVPGLAFVGVFCTLLPHWLWYGEKVLITGTVLWVALAPWLI